MSTFEGFAFSTFCDDIRYEVGGKHSLIGIYRDDIVISGSFPVLLAKLGVSVTHIQHPSQPPTDFDVVIYLPGDPDDQPSFAAHIETPKIPAVPDAEPDKRRFLNLHFILSPITLKEQGLIKVRLRLPDRELKAGTLIVRSEEQSSSAPSSGRPLLQATQ